jgi:protein gp37
MSDAYWRQPIAWDRDAAAGGRRDRVFCASMADVFEDRRDLDVPRERLWQLIVETPHLDWLLLTKRPQHVAPMAPWGAAWPRNVWLGTTVENQRWAEKRLPHLLAIPAAVHFVSCEPLLGQLDLGRWLSPSRIHGHLGWVIAGGESGHRARPMNPHWACALRDQCQAHGVPFHFKQWGNWRPAGRDAISHNVRLLSGSDGAIAMVRLNKKRAGRILDGQEWDGFPAIA